MKRIVIETAAVMSVVALAACSEKTIDTVSPPVSVPETADVSVFNITTEGYASDDPDFDGLFRLELAAKDAVGLFIVHADGSVEVLRMVLESDGSWNIALNNDDVITWTEGDRYFAYYPQDSKIDAASVNLQATSEEEFFADVIAGWTVAADQSEDFGVSSLLTASGVYNPDGGTGKPSIDICLSPKTALVCFVPECTTYVFDNTPAIPDYNNPLQVDFDGIDPFNDGGRYFYKTNPADGTGFSGTAGGEKWSQSISGVGPGEVVVIPVGRASEIHHTLQPGDFFLSDGNLLSRDADAAVVSSADVIGMVTNIDPDRIGQAAKDALGGVVHGTVTSTRENSVYAWYGTQGNDSRDESSIGLEVLAFAEYTPEKNLEILDADVDGYGYTSAIFSKRAEDVASGKYPLFRSAQLFSNVVGGPEANAVTTGWYVPAMGELMDFFRTACGMSLTSSDDTFGGMPNDIWMWWTGTGVDIAAAINGSMSKVSMDDKTFLDNADPYTRFYWTSSVSADNLALTLYFYALYEDTEPEENLMLRSSYKSAADGGALSRLVLVF